MAFPSLRQCFKELTVNVWLTHLSAPDPSNLQELRHNEKPKWSNEHAGLNNALRRGSESLFVSIASSIV